MHLNDKWAARCELITYVALGACALSFPIALLLRGLK